MAILSFKKDVSKQRNVTWNGLTDLRGDGDEGSGRDKPKDIYAYMHSLRTQTTMW